MTLRSNWPGADGDGARFGTVFRAIGGQVIPVGQASAPVVCAERENSELRIQNYERRRRRVTKRVAPNEAKLRANARPEGNYETEERSAVSDQRSVVSGVFSGDPQGSAGELRNADFGLRIGNQEKERQFHRLDACESRTTNHESRKCSVAEQSHFVATSCRLWGKIRRRVAKLRGVGRVLGAPAQHAGQEERPQQAIQHAQHDEPAEASV